MTMPLPVYNQLFMAIEENEKLKQKVIELESQLLIERKEIKRLTDLKDKYKEG